MKKTTWLRLWALALLWGSEFAFVKVALRGLNSAELVAVRLFLAAIFLFTFAKTKREPIPRDRGLYLHCAILGLAAISAPYFLMALAETKVSSALTGILVGSGPLMTAVLATIFLPAERMTMARFAGLAIGLVGVVLVIDPFHANVSGDVLGSIAALGVALGFAIGYVYNVRFLTNNTASGPMIMSIQSMLGACYALTWVAVSGDWHYSSNHGAIESVILLGLFNTGLASIVFFDLLRTAGAVTTSIVEYLMVLVAVVLGLIFLSESISFITSIGVALVIVGVAITERKPKSVQTTGLE